MEEGEDDDDDAVAAIPLGITTAGEAMVTGTGWYEAL